MNNPPGLDVGAVYEDIRRLTLRFCGPTIRHNQWDPEDVISLVCQTLLLRQRGTCPYDPSKGSKANYIIRCAQQTVINYHKKRGMLLLADVPDDPDEPTSTPDTDSRALQDLLAELHPTERRYAGYVIQDAKITEIAKAEGVKPEVASKIRQRTIAHMKAILSGC